MSTSDNTFTLSTRHCPIAISTQRVRRILVLSCPCFVSSPRLLFYFSVFSSFHPPSQASRVPIYTAVPPPCTQCLCRYWLATCRRLVIVYNQQKECCRVQLACSLNADWMQIKCSFPATAASRPFLPTAMLAPRVVIRRDTKLLVSATTPKVPDVSRCRPGPAARPCNTIHILRFCLPAKGGDWRDSSQTT